MCLFKKKKSQPLRISSSEASGPSGAGCKAGPRNPRLDPKVRLFLSTLGR